MSEDVARSWREITDWLATTFPADAARIAPPAGSDAVAAVRATMGADLPPDLVAWWSLQNGFAEVVGAVVIPPEFVPMSAEEALRSRNSWIEHWNGAVADGFSGFRPDDLAAEGEEPVDPHDDDLSDADAHAAYIEQHLRRPAGSPCTVAFLPAWLPIADGSSAGGLFVDLRDGPAHGCVRWFDRTGGAEHGIWWPSVARMLAETAVALRTGTPIRGHSRTTNADGNLWWDPAVVTTGADVA